MLFFIISYSANVEIWSQIGLQIPALRSGVEVRSRVFVQSPIPCSFSYNHQKQTINAQCSGPEQKMNLVEAELTPYTFIHEMKRESEKKAYISNEKQITNRRLVRPIQMNVSERFKFPPPLIFRFIVTGVHPFVLFIHALLGGTLFCPIQ